MERHHFDDLVRMWAESRRAFLGGALAAVSGLLVGPRVEARKKRKHKKKEKKARPNEFGCLEVGDPCQSEEECCSGLCEGKKGKTKCGAHFAGTCEPQPGACLSPNPAVVLCNYTTGCYCFRTTANSIFCADGQYRDCADCKKDSDCVALGYPAGSACLPYSEGVCTGVCNSGMACAPPCGYVPPED